MCIIVLFFIEFSAFFQYNYFGILCGLVERKTMRKLALTDDILMKIEKPARYIGNEVNSVIKDKSKIDIRFAMCFPDVYEIGMSHLGIQILYDMFNRRKMYGARECTLHGLT